MNNISIKLKNLPNAKIPVFGFVGYSGSGKTTLLEQIIMRFSKLNWQVGVIKHAHHNFDIDYPGKDSYVLRKAGAHQTIIASHQRWALIEESTHKNSDPDLNTLIDRLNQSQLDILFVEGFKHSQFNKIEVFRQELGHDYLFPTDPGIIAIASNSALIPDCPIDLVDINNIDQVVSFILKQLVNYTFE